MKKIPLIFAFLSLIVWSDRIIAQENTEAPADSLQLWKFGGAGSLTFSQVSFTNWAAGGENSYSLNGLMNLHANYKKDRTTWENTLDMGYGIIKQGEKEVRKTDDKLEFMSKFGYKTNSNWYYSGMLNFKTQFGKGYKYNDAAGTKQLTADLFSPAYVILSAGMEYKPNDDFYFFLSPLTGKATIVMDDTLSARGAYGVEANESFRMEMGGFMKMAYTKEVLKNVKLNTKVDVFSNYLDKPQNLDINWEVLISMKINEYLSANVNTILLYDDNINYVDDDGVEHGPRIQFKEIIGVGLSYSF